MSRNCTQMEDDARAAAEAVRAAGRPLRVAEIAEALRRKGRQQTDKQARITVGRAEALRLLHRRNAYLWDSGPSTGAVAPRMLDGAGPQTPELLVLCARRMLELPPSTENNRATRRLLDIVAQHLAVPANGAARSGIRAAGVVRAGAPANGAASDDDPEVQVLLSSVT